MSLPVFLALLAAAAMHASWNALVRRDTDRDAASVSVAAGGAVVGLLVALFLPGIARKAIPFVLASSSIHIVYYALVARAYRYGELSVVYPIMRGLAPVIVAFVSALFIEPATLAQLAGVAIVGVGIMTLGAQGLRSGPAGIGAALMNAFVIAGYTLIDGLGSRASGNPLGYAAWLLFGGGVATVSWRLYFDGPGLALRIRKRAALAAFGGIMGYGAYAIALWAMTIAPIGVVAAVRESSVLFATALGAIFLAERFGALRWIAAVLVVAGLALIEASGAP